MTKSLSLRFLLLLPEFGLIVFAHYCTLSNSIVYLWYTAAISRCFVEKIPPLKSFASCWAAFRKVKQAWGCWCAQNRTKTSASTCSYNYQVGQNYHSKKGKYYYPCLTYEETETPRWLVWWFLLSWLFCIDIYRYSFGSVFELQCTSLIPCQHQCVQFVPKSKDL